MTNDPLVFIIILNWNGRRDLLKVLRSVFCLKYGNYQVVVVDNDSTDGSFEDARQNFGKAHFIKNEANVGFARGMNVGIRFALGKGAKYIWLLNNDVLVDRNSLKKLVSVAQQQRNNTLLSPIILTPKGEVWFSGGEIRWFRMRVEHTKNVVSETKSYETGFLSGCALFFSREVIRKLDLFNERYFLYYEDADLSVRAKRAGMKLLIVPKAVVVHQERSNENPEKLYHLVLSGLIFFFSRTPWFLLPWTFCFTMARRMKNAIDRSRKKPQALIVGRAYRDYAAKTPSF